MENKLIPYHATRCISAACVLVFAPHPDDEVFGCGGAILRHLEAVVSVQVVIVSDGAYGAEGEKRAQIVAQRQAESRNAAVVLGYGEPEFWGLPDRGLHYGETLIQRMVDKIQAAGADLVYAPSLLEMHPDHRALAMCAIEAARRSQSRPVLALYEIGVPLSPNLLIDITELAERKMMAMQCFVSQNEKQRYDLDIAALNRYRTYTLPAEVTAAEAYVVVSAEDLANDPFRLYQTEHERQRGLGLALDVEDVPLVSVIVRSNDGFVSSELLDTVALQTYPNIEVLVVNANGPDHSAVGAWCGNFPMRLIDAGNAVKPGSASNAGFGHARGEYLIILDDDGGFMPEHISLLVDALTRNPECKVAYSRARGVNAQNKPVGKNYGQIFDRTLLLAENYIPIHTALFSRSLVDAGCRFDESQHQLEDWSFWLQASAYTNFIFVPHFSAYCRIEDSAIGAMADAASMQEAAATLFEKWSKAWRREDLLDTLAHVQELNATIIEREVEVESLGQVMSEREDQVANLSQVLNERQSQLENLGQALSERVRQVENLVLSLDERASQVADRDRQIGDLAQERARQEVQINSVTAERDAAVWNFFQIRQTSSWRLTAPFRFLGHLMHGNFDLAGNVIRELGRRIARWLPVAVLSALQRFYGRFLSVLGVLPNSSVNHAAIASLVSRRCALTNHSRLEDPLSAPEPQAWEAIDISIVTYNSSRWIAGFVGSLIALDYPKALLTVRFVDNGSTDSTVADLQAVVPVLRAAGFTVEILQQPNHGFGAGHNAAILKGSSPLCWVTNVDILFEPDALRRVVACALADSDQTAAWELRQKPYEHAKYYDPVTGLTNWNSHACILLRRSALEQVGYYDDALFMYGEDVELSYRLRRAGHQLRYCPQAVVWHYTYDSPNQTKPLQYWQHFCKLVPAPEVR